MNEKERWHNWIGEDGPAPQPAPQAFWLVVSARTLAPASMIYTSEAEARREAERLARMNACRYYVLRCIASVEVQPAPVVWTPLV